MKTTKLFFALAIAASLAACTKEVLVEPEKSVDSFDKIKGAKVVANGFSIDPMSEAQTKVIVDNGVPSWSDGDNAGVAWFVGTKAVNDPQTTVKLTSLKPTAWANHKLEYGEDRFQSNSNVYEGWHVAYYPYQEMTRPGELTFTVNPVMDKKINSNDDYGRELYENNILLSSAYHISNDVEGSVKVKDGVIQETMPLHFVTNILRPRFTLAPEFTAKEIKDLQIVSVTLTAGKSDLLFAPTLTVNPAYFPTAGDGFEEEDFGKTGDKVALHALDASYTNSVTTIVSTENPEDYKLGAESLNFRMFIAPVPAPAKALTAASFTVKVTLSDNSYFTLKAGNDKESKNYKTFKKLASCLNNDAEAQGNNLQTVNVDKDGRLNPINLDLDLTVAEYSLKHSAADYDEWCTAIDLAAAMGAEEVPITVTGEIVFDTEHPLYTGDFESIEVTTNKNGVLAFADEITWSDKITLKKNVPVVVKEGGVLTVGEKGLTTTGQITNNGTIVLVEGAKLPTGSIVNNGTIEVSVGSVIVAPTGAGKVVYTVNETVTTDKIDALIANASLNTLVVNADLQSDAALNWPLTVEMNSAVLTADVTATAINVNKLANAAINGNIAGDVSVAGTAKINAAMIDGDLEIVSGGNVTLTGTSQYGFMQTGMIVNNGTLTVNSDVYVAGIETNSGSKTTTKKEFTIWYPQTYYYENNGGSVTARIKKYTVIDPAKGYQIYDGVYIINEQNGLASVFSALTDEDVNPVISLNSDVTLDSGDLGGVAANGTITINANDSEITFNETGNKVDYISVPEGVKLVVNDATISRSITGTDLDPHSDALIFDCEVEFNNVIFTNFIELAKGATLTNVTVSSTTNNYGIWVLTHGQTVTLAGKNSINMPNGRGIKICETHTPHTIAAPTLNVAGTTFVTAEKAAIVVRSEKGATINWLEGNNIEGVAADQENEIWIDNAMGSNYAYFNNVKVNGADKSIEPTI